MNFQQLLDRLKAWLNVQVRNGALTERGLARRAGMSQSHIHNVLKGARILTPSTADRILRGLGLTVLDLLDSSGDGAVTPPPARRLRRRPLRRPPRGRSPRPVRPSSPN